MIEIKNCPSLLTAGFDSYSPRGRRELFGGARVNHLLDFEFEGLRKDRRLTDAMHRISVSGVQEKFPAVVVDGQIRLASTDDRSRYILKPAPWDDTLQSRKLVPVNEHLTMQIARQVYGIQTADNGLCFTPKGQPVYITRRFDVVADGSKLEMEDFATVVGRNEQTDGKEFKYSGSFEEIAHGIRQNVAAWMVDMERFFDLVVFNYIFANGDDHLKNFSLIRQGADLRLAPAYDLLNTSLHVDGDDLGLDGGLSPNLDRSDVWDRTGHPCRKDFQQFGLLIGLLPKRVEKLLDRYMSIPDAAISLVERSFLPKKQKRYYLSIVQERIARFRRG